uniref:IMV membrane protein n=1 Tax=Rousettus bat poxvirus TaxID=3141933 RepID=A0AAU7E253_9POXV
MSYLRYLNIYDDFDAGAGVMESELFTPDEKASFLPVTGTGVGAGLGIGGAETFFSALRDARDMRLMAGLVLLVVAINTASWFVALILLLAAATMIPLQYIVVTYCLCMQMMHPNAANHFGMATLCIILALLVLIVQHFRRVDVTILIALYILLGLLFITYILRLPQAPGRVCAMPRVVPSFSDTY